MSINGCIDLRWCAEDCKDCKVGDVCLECGGKTVMFKGRGLYLQYKVCSKWEERGHLTRREILDEIKERRREV